jgi:Glycosyl hydrolases family 43
MKAHLPTKRWLSTVLALLGTVVFLGVTPAHAAHGGEWPVTTIVSGDSHGATIRFDTNGNAIDAHDGEIRRFGDRYYLYGTSYGCGYVRFERPVTPWCGYRSYSSTDMVHWTDDGPLFDATTAYWQSRCDSATSSCYRPHVVYNARTHKYVLWMNSYDVPVDYHVLTSSSPAGPFTEVALPHLAVNGGGDMDVFVDGDGTAYLAYADTASGYDIVVEKLDPSYTSGTGQFTRLGVQMTEAPSLFRRNGTYYIMLSDPYCAYCAGTGAAYLTAPSPLGPWKTDLRSDTELSSGMAKVIGQSAYLNIGQAWTDYDYSFSTIPLQTGTGNGFGYAQAGWLFRAQNAANGYAWIIGNYPHPGALGGNLTKVVYSGGNIASVSTEPLPFPVVAGQRYDIRTSVRGSTLSTYINGTLVDTTTDGTYHAGTVGFREDGTESAWYGNVSVTAPDGTSLFSDNFATAADLDHYVGLAPRPRGFPISNDSCGGQPTDVAALPGRGGPVYLFQSDRWNNGDQNEALATQYWEPLRFNADGSIQQLTCGNSYSLALAGLKAGHDNVPQDLDQTSGSAGFRAHCDIAGTFERAQTFVAGRTGTLSRLAVETFQAGHPNGPVQMAVTSVTAAGNPGTVLWSGTVPASQLSWSPQELTARPGIRVTQGQQYAVVLSAPGVTQGCYGFTYSDDNPYAAGGEMYAPDGTTWHQEPGRDLKFNDSVTATSQG